MKKLLLLIPAVVLLSPVAAFAGSATDAALGLGAFAVFNQLFGGVRSVPVYAPPAYVPPPPVVVVPQPAPVVVHQYYPYYAPAPVYSYPPPVYAYPAPVYAAPAPVYYPPARVIVIHKGRHHHHEDDD